MALFRLFVQQFRYFDFLRGVISSFRLLARCYFVFSSFRAALFRLFVISRGVISSFRVALFRCEITKRQNGTNKPPYTAEEAGQEVNRSAG